MKLWMILGLAAPLSIAAPFAIPLLAQDQAATQAAAPEKRRRRRRRLARLRPPQKRLSSPTHAGGGR